VNEEKLVSKRSPIYSEKSDTKFQKCYYWIPFRINIIVWNYWGMLLPHTIR